MLICLVWIPGSNHGTSFHGNHVDSIKEPRHCCEGRKRGTNGRQMWSPQAAKVLTWSFLLSTWALPADFSQCQGPSTICVGLWEGLPAALCALHLLLLALKPPSSSTPQLPPSLLLKLRVSPSEAASSFLPPCFPGPRIAHVSFARLSNMAL